MDPDQQDRYEHAPEGERLMQPRLRIYPHPHDQAILVVDVLDAQGRFVRTYNVWRNK